MCSMCNRALSDICDHVIPADVAVMQAQISGKYLDRYAGYFIRSNLQGLCRQCHYMKTNADKLHTGPWPDVVERDALTVKKVWSVG
jgi:5-methylcytosine-specific restriction endonuclease McrA